MKKHLPWCGALLLIVLILFGKYLFSTTHVVSEIGTDIYAYYLHSQTFASSELGQGNLPVWNPYTYGGHPFLADFQSAMLYPPSWILGMLNPVTAINWWVSIHVLLFGLLAYIWAAMRGMKPGAAFVAGAAAMLGGTFYMHVYAGHVSNLGTMAWAPLVFIGIDGWLRSKHAGWLVAGAAGVALQVYAGHPQYVYYTAIIAGLYSLVHLPYLGRQFRRTALGLLALYPMAVLLCAAQLLPGYCALSETVRSTGASYEFASMFSLNPENLLTLFAPWLYGGMGRLYIGGVVTFGRCSCFSAFACWRWRRTASRD
ncbi:YfhO family protein [Ereboglobus luteus]|uniref:YfhO family protein n=1 Tax=Ereboglobus luteus TaxID=1796921 RepID=UPI001374B41B|nr:YfhO family protein [Ereboglobus luteus]